MDLAAECTWAEWIPVIVLHEVFVGGICVHLLQLSFLRERDGSRFNWPWLKSVVTHLLIVHFPYFTNTSGIAREPLIPLPNSDQCSGALREDRTRAFLISKACCWIPVPYVREDAGKWHSILQEYPGRWFFCAQMSVFFPVADNILRHNFLPVWAIWPHCTKLCAHFFT